MDPEIEAAIVAYWEASANAESAHADHQSKVAAAAAATAAASEAHAVAANSEIEKRRAWRALREKIRTRGEEG